MDRSDGPRPLKTILDAEMERRDWRRAKWVYRLRQAWSLVVGEFLAKHTLLVSVDSHAVVIAVESSSWTQELTYWKPEILRRLSEITQGDIHHVEIRVRVWSKPFDSSAESGHSPRERGQAYHNPVVTSDDLTELLTRVKDNYRNAVEYWIHSDYVPCARCQSPTLKGYEFCACCEREQADKVNRQKR